MYNYLIVGAGLTGATLARLLTNHGKSVLVIDKNNFVGGACHDRFFDKLPVCKFGVHVFHTNNQAVWNFANQYSSFIPYEHRVKARLENDYYPLPINLLTLNMLYGIKTPQEALEYFKKLPYVGESNFEEKAISTIGTDLYYKFFYWYTKKQWGVEPRILPASIFSRLPVRCNLDDRYFSDKYQAMPEEGYTKWISNMLNGIDVSLETAYHPDLDKYNKLIYTGSIDEYFGYQFGKLEYRSIEHEYTIEESDNLGGATVNYTGNEVDYSRATTFNHLYPHIKNNKFITIKEWFISKGNPLYPIPTEKNNHLYDKYKSISKNVFFAGRLGSYKYINMDIAIENAMKLSEEILSNG